MPRRLRDITYEIPQSNMGIYNPIEYKPQAPDISLLVNRMDKIDAERKEAIEKQTALNVALSQVELDESEDEWKQNYINDLNRQIDYSIDNGDYNSAINTGIRLAGKAAVDPALTGRERYNKQRTEWLDTLEKRRLSGDIDDDTYNRALAINTYNYQDIRDNNGNIVAGSKWTPEFNPVSDVSFNTVFDGILKYIGRSSNTTTYGASDNYTFVDKDGNITQDSTKAVNIAKVVKNTGGGHSIEQLTFDQLDAAFDAYLIANPQIKSALIQKHDTMWWNMMQADGRSIDNTLSEADRISAENEAREYRKGLQDKDGGFLTTENWIKQSVTPMLNAMAYKKETTSHRSVETAYDSKWMSNKQIAASVGINEDQAELYRLGFSARILQKSNAKNTTELYNWAKANGEDTSWYEGAVVNNNNQ